MAKEHPGGQVQAQGDLIGGSAQAEATSRLVRAEQGSVLQELG